MTKRQGARRQREREKARKIKSEMYVHASDDETDDERDRGFFESERRRQDVKNASFGLSKAPTLDTGKTLWDRILDGDSDDDQLASTQQDQSTSKAGKPRKRKSELPLDSSDGEERSTARSSQEAEAKG